MALPNTYKQLPYIESNGTQYIAPSIAGNVVGRVECALTFTANTRQIFFGCWADSSYRSYIIERTSSGNFSASAGGMTFTAQNTIAMPVGQRNVIDYNLNSNYVDVNGTRAYTTNGYPSTSRALYLFASNDSQASGGYAKTSCQLEYLKVYNKSGTLTYDYIPALRLSDNVAGIYDLVNDTFRASSNSYAFSYPIEVSAEANPYGSGTITGTGLYEDGDNVTLEAIPSSNFEFVDWELNGYTKLDYIESSGTQYIDTGVVVGVNDIEVHATFKYTSFTSSGQVLFGASVSNRWFFFNADGSTRWKVQIGGGDTEKYINGVDTNWHTLSLDSSTGTFKFDDTELSLTSSSVNIGQNIYAFARNSAGSVSQQARCCISDLTIYKAGLIVRDYIPVKRDVDGVIGLLDLVELKFYTNKGTGTFAYGQELGSIKLNDNPLSFVVHNFVDLMANFMPTYNITINYDSTLGSATYDWVSATEIELVATPNANAQFKGWYVNSVQISANDTYVYPITQDTTIEARFEPIYEISDSVDGNGAIQYTRGVDQNDVTFSVIADTNNHFVKYDVDGTEYTTTPLYLHLTQNISITAYFEEDDRYTISTKTNFNNGSIYLSDNNVFAGTDVVAWARPFPDYNFVKWEDGSYENPRTITVNSNVTLVAEYQRTFETNGIYQYRCYIKDQLDLEALPKAFMVVDTFDISTDLLTNATSSIKVMDLLSDVDEGDVLVLYDPMGTTLYTGVINSIEDKTINCSQMQSFYKGTWIYNTSSQDYLEHEIAVLLQDYADGKLYHSTYVDPLVAQRLGGITIDYTGATAVNLPSDLDSDGNEQMTTYDMEEFIYELYQKYGIIFDFEINVSGTNYVHIKVPSFQTIKVGNNMYAIQNMSPITEIEETNKLVVYAQDKTYRTTYIATKNSIVEEPSTTANRFNITNTEVVFSDDPIADLVANNLPEQMFNHKVTFTLIIRNFIYEFGDFNLGGELDIFYNDDYFNSILTGYDISKQSNQNIVQVDFVCGKVRTALTKILTLGKV
jgi:hypothetical protein